jgi:hypothetical protein
MYRSLIIELVQISPSRDLLRPLPTPTLALAPDLHRVLLSTAGFASSGKTTGKPQPQYLAPATILTKSNTIRVIRRQA